MKRIFSLLVLLMMNISLTQAQGAPEQINAALGDLSNRVGVTLQISNLSNWNWSQDTYPNSALGCATAQGTGSDTVGYQFTLMYGGSIYDYRVSADSTIVIMCGQIDPNQPTATPALDEQYSNRLCPAPEDTPFMRSRVVSGMEAEVVSGVLNLRAEANPNAAVVTQIPTGQPFKLNNPPTCADGIVWWQAQYNAFSGYVAEGQNGEYFIQPKTPAPLQSRQIITVTNITDLQEFTVIEGNFLPEIAWTSQNPRIVLPGGFGSDSLWVYDTAISPLAPRIIEDNEAMTTIEYHPNGQQVMFGTEQGTVHLWNIVPNPNANILETLFLNTHQRDISAIAFSPDGAKFASAGINALTTANVDKTYAVLIWDIQSVIQTAVIAGHSDVVNQLAWSPDGTRLASVSDDDSVRWWDANSGAQTGILDLGADVNAVTYSANGQFVAVGTDNPDSKVYLIDAATEALVATYTSADSSGVSALSFSPDSTLLLSGYFGGNVTIWNTQSDQPVETLVSEYPVMDVAFHPDGSLIAVATDKLAVTFYGVPFAG